MKLLTLIIALTSSLVSYSQVSNYVIDFNYSASMYEGQEASYHAFNFSPGAEYKNGLTLNFGIGYMKAKSLSYTTYNFRKSDGFQLSFSGSKRLLNGTTKLSPLAGITIGSTVYNHHRGCFSNSGEVECDNVMFTEVPRIDKFRFFAKAKFMLDFKLSNLNLRFGPTYTFHEGRMVNDPKERSESRFLGGYGLEAGMVFSLSPRKMKEGFFIPSRGMI